MDLSTTNPGAEPRPRRVHLWPPIIFVPMVAVLGIGLLLDPRLMPSPLIGRPVPAFSLPPVQGRAQGLETVGLQSQVPLVNVFASWCMACREEHPRWMELVHSCALALHGLNYKDKPDDAQRWLGTLGDPYIRTGAERARRSRPQGGPAVGGRRHVRAAAQEPSAQDHRAGAAAGAPASMRLLELGAAQRRVRRALA